MSKKYRILSFVIHVVMILSFLVFQLIAEIEERQARVGTIPGPLENHALVWTEKH